MMISSGQVINERQQDQQQQQQQSIITGKYGNTNGMEFVASSTGLMINHHAQDGGHEHLHHSSNLQQLRQQLTTIGSQTDGHSKPDGVLGGAGHQSSDDNDNSTGSWNANSLTSSNGSHTQTKRPSVGVLGSGGGGGGGSRLSVILPQTQKSLLTPTIALTNEHGATPNQLFSSLIQLNGQELGLFTDLPSCTPTSADGLARAGINPFFWGVQLQQQQQGQQKSPNHLMSVNLDNHADHHQPATNYNNPPQLSSNCEHQHLQQANNKSTPTKCPTAAANGTADAESKERRHQLSKLSIDQLQAANAMILTSPITSFLLSPENEAWLRLNFRNHPLSAGKLDQQQQQHQNQNHHATTEPASVLTSHASGPLEQANPTPDATSQHPVLSNSCQQREAQDLTSNQMIAFRLNNNGAVAAATTTAVAPNNTQAQILSQSTVCQTPSPINIIGGYNALVQHQVPAPPSIAPSIITSTSSFINGHHQQQLVSANFGSNSSQLIYQSAEGQAQQQQSPSTVSNHANHANKQIVHPTNISSGQQQIKIITRPPPVTNGQPGEGGRDLANTQTQGSMGPPAAHHQQQQQQPQPHPVPLQRPLQVQQNHPHQLHPQGSLLVMGPHPLDPRFVVSQHHTPSSMNVPDYDGAPKSIGLYDPHLQQLFLAQKHQQEIYNLHQQQHQYHQQQQQQQQQHNQQQYLSYQQQTLPPYHVMPNEQVQQQHLQTQPIAAVATGYDGPTSHDANTETGTIDGDQNNNSNNNNNIHHTDVSSNSNGSSSASVSPHHRQDHLSAQSGTNSSISSSARSSVSRDTNSIDVIATSGSLKPSTNGGGCNEPAIHKTQAKSNNSTKQSNNSKHNTTKQQAIKKITNDKSVIGSTNSTGDQVLVVKKKSKGGRKKKIVTNEELLARKNRSKERNRVAAKRCRQKRKQFLDELRGRIDNLNDLNKKLAKENNQLKGEVEQLRKHHKVCVAN